MTDQPRALPQARIFVETSLLIRKLKSFEKTRHYVPTSASGSALEMVEQLTREELDSDLDQIYTALRGAYGLKRRQIDIHGPDDRQGVIETPYFNYEVRVELDESSPDTIIWRREINNIRDVSQVVGPEFEACFKTGNWVLEVAFENSLDIEQMIDAIEDLEDGSIKVDYDKGLEWCEIKASDQPATLRATGNAFQVRGVRAMSPRDLITSMFDYQSRLSTPVNTLPGQ